MKKEVKAIYKTNLPYYTLQHDIRETKQGIGIYSFKATSKKNGMFYWFKIPNRFVTQKVKYDSNTVFFVITLYEYTNKQSTNILAYNETHKKIVFTPADFFNNFNTQIYI